ncbi:uncharacterized protein PSANT_02478 [Moesziomyces antarcticus]|uniref:Uncharacterized protein n=1 Tax=Pseudozyma antarctica TaxID=84753 RepID=A0A5C3FKA0_PSEA2|nr:uncharacterized protein PSANT_02478 [Moesziomyces antarcticus]
MAALDDDKHQMHCKPVRCIEDDVHRQRANVTRQLARRLADGGEQRRGDACGFWRKKLTGVRWLRSVGWKQTPVSHTTHNGQQTTESAAWRTVGQRVDLPRVVPTPYPSAMRGRAGAFPAQQQKVASARIPGSHTEPREHAQNWYRQAAPDSIARRRHQHAQTQQAMMRRTTRLSWISASVAAIVRAWASSAPSAALPIVLAKHTQGRQSTCKARSNHSWGGHAVFGAQGVHGKDGPRQPSKQRGASAPRQRFPCIGGAKARRLVAQTGVRARVAAPDEPHRESVDLAPRPTALARSSVASIPMPTPNAAVAAVATLQSGASRQIAELQLASPPRSSFTRRSLWPKCPRLAKIDTRRLPRLDARRRAAAADEHMPLCLCAAPLSAPAWTAISPVHLDRLDRSTARDAAIYALAAAAPDHRS